MLRVMLNVDNIPINIELVPKGTKPKSNREVVIDYIFLPVDFVRAFHTYRWTGKRFVKNNLILEENRIIENPMFTYTPSLPALMLDDEPGFPDPPVVEPDALSFTVNVTDLSINYTPVVILKSTSSGEVQISYDDEEPATFSLGVESPVALQHIYSTVGERNINVTGDLNLITELWVMYNDSNRENVVRLGLNDLTVIPNLVVFVSSNLTQTTTPTPKPLTSCCLPFNTTIFNGLNNLRAIVSHGPGLIGSINNLSDNIIALDLQNPSAELIIDSIPTNLVYFSLKFTENCSFSLDIFNNNSFITTPELGMVFPELTGQLTINSLIDYAGTGPNENITGDLSKLLINDHDMIKLSGINVTYNPSVTGINPLSYSSKIDSLYLQLTDLPIDTNQADQLIKDIDSISSIGATGTINTDLECSSSVYDIERQNLIDKGFTVYVYRVTTIVSDLSFSINVIDLNQNNTPNIIFTSNSNGQVQIANDTQVPSTTFLTAGLETTYQTTFSTLGEHTINVSGDLDIITQLKIVYDENILIENRVPLTINNFGLNSLEVFEVGALSECIAFSNKALSSACISNVDQISHLSTLKVLRWDGPDFTGNIGSIPSSLIALSLNNPNTELVLDSLPINVKRFELSYPNDNPVMLGLGVTNTTEHVLHRSYVTTPELETYELTGGLIINNPVDDCGATEKSNFMIYFVNGVLSIPQTEISLSGITTEYGNYLSENTLYTGSEINHIKINLDDMDGILSAEMDAIIMHLDQVVTAGATGSLTSTHYRNSSSSTAVNSLAAKGFTVNVPVLAG